MSPVENRVVSFKKAASGAKRGQRWFAIKISLLSLAIFTATFYWPDIEPHLTEAASPALASSGIPVNDLLVPASQRHPSDRFTCTVTGIYDGDGPIYCREGHSIRLHAIAAREMDETCRTGHPCPSASGAAAKRELQSLALGHTLTCEQTGISYNRITAICWTEQNLELNCAMVSSGKAALWPSYNRRRSICS